MTKISHGNLKGQTTRMKRAQEQAQESETHSFADFGIQIKH